MDEHKSALRTAAMIAYRSFDSLTEQERSDVLVALMATGNDDEADLANKTLYHLREQRRLQLTLRSILETPKA